MSAAGKKVAIVSLGMACQSSWQIRKHIRLLRELTQDRSLRESSMPFDWLISQPDGASKLIRDQAFFPESPEEITRQGGRPWWGRYNTYFWHDFTRKRAPIPISEGFENARQKYNHLWSKFQSIRNVERKIFVISNVQNNLDMVAETTGTVDFHFKATQLGNLMSAADAWTEAGSNEYLVVSYEDRIDPDIHLRNTKIITISKDESEWEGSKDAWNFAFKTYFSS